MNPCHIRDARRGPSDGWWVRKERRRVVGRRELLSSAEERERVLSVSLVAGAAATTGRSSSGPETTTKGRDNATGALAAELADGARELLHGVSACVLGRAPMRVGVLCGGGWREGRNEEERERESELSAQLFANLGLAGWAAAAASRVSVASRNELFADVGGVVGVLL